MPSLLPFTSRLRRKAGWARPFAALADETVELAPASAVHAPALMALPDEVERVVSYKLPPSSRIGELMTERDVLHPATKAMRFRRGWIADGSVYVRGDVRSLRDRTGPPFWSGRLAA